LEEAIGFRVDMSVILPGFGATPRSNV